jgi:hypothetical protein
MHWARFVRVDTRYMGNINLLGSYKWAAAEALARGPMSRVKHNPWLRIAL